MSEDLQALLDSYNVNTLVEMGMEANLVPRQGKRPTKGALIDILKAGLFTEARVKRAWNALNERERAVLNRLLGRREGVATRLFERECVRARLALAAPDSEGGMGRYNPNVPYADAQEYIGLPTRPDSAVFPDIIARLTRFALVFSRLPAEMQASAQTNYRLQFHPAETLFVPDAVRHHLPAPPPVADEPSGWTPARVAGGNAAVFLRELYIYWDYARRNDVQLLQSGLVGKRALKALNQALMEPDPSFERAGTENETRKLLFLRLLLQALGLVKPTSGKLVATADTQSGLPDLWTQELPAQTLSVLRAWTGLSRDPTIDSEVLRLGPNLQAGREALLTALKGRTPDVWFEPDELVEAIRGRSVNFLFSERTQFESRRFNSNYYSTYWGGAYFGSVSALLKQLDAAERKFVRNALDSLPLTLGLVEVGYDERDPKTWYAARLTSLGQAVLAHFDGRGGKTVTLPSDALPQLPTSDQGRVVVQPNFQILALGPVKLATLARLDVFAERRKTDVGATEYHLSRESVYRGQQAGMSVAEIAAFLTENTGADLPQNVQRSLEEWAAHHERITFRSGATLLQAADAASLQALLADPNLGPHLARPLAPDVALVKPRHRQRLADSLLQHGVLPAVSDDQPSSADHSVVIDEQGTIRPVHAVPSLHLSGRLARFAERRDEGWALTPDSIRHAAGDRQKVLDLIRELDKLQRGALPLSVVEMVKRYGAYYGDSAVETLTLVEFRDLQALDELLRDPALKKLLTRFPAGDRALAVVDPQHLPEVERRLTELGVAVKQSKHA